MISAILTHLDRAIFDFGRTGALHCHVMSSLSISKHGRKSAKTGKMGLSLNCLKNGVENFFKNFPFLGKFFLKRLFRVDD